jgi:hypothetical protein
VIPFLLRKPRRPTDRNRRKQGEKEMKNNLFARFGFAGAWWRVTKNASEQL